jgi:hypothetical protein
MYNSFKKLVLNTNDKFGRTHQNTFFCHVFTLFIWFLKVNTILMVIS